MQDKHAKMITIQWILPLAVLFLTVVIMLVNFSVNSKEKARIQVEKNLISTAENYGIRVKSVLDMIMGIQEPLASMLSEKSESNTLFVKDTVSAIAANGRAYLSVYCNVEGMAVLSGYMNQSLIDTSYFSRLEGEEKFFFFVEDDGITGRRAIVAVCPVITGKKLRGYLLSYFNPETIVDLIKKIEFDMDVFYVLADVDGKVLETYGMVENTSLIDKEVFWDALRGDAKENAAIDIVKLRLKNKTSGIFYAGLGQEKRAFIYAPVGVEDWFWVMGVNESYVKAQENMAWKETRDMLLRLVAAVFIFLGLLAVINIITRIRAMEQNKALENKADTDLLTDLNNKLATERKIKEYIRDNPGKQAVMLVLDIDNFKKINDTMGHAFGDEVLRTLGKQIRSEFRVSDIIGRTGGDEFMIFLKDMKDEGAIEQEGRKVERFFQNFEVGEYVKYSATASIGAAVFPKDATNFEGLYKAADRALYIAKKRGKNQLAFYKAEKS